MNLAPHNPADLYPTYANYAHAIEVPAGSRLLFVSGLNGFDRSGLSMPSDFEGQATQIWDHLESILANANMTPANLVSLRFYLATPAQDPANVAILKRRLGTHHCARTVICTGLLEPGWLVEIEAVAASN